MNDLIIEAKGLYKTYRGAEKAAVDRIDLTVEKGSFFGLLGPNGAGKTTTLAMLTGLLEPDDGLLKVAGFDIRTSLDEVKRRIGLVPQEISLYPSLTAQENLAYFGMMQGLSGNALNGRIGDCLEFARLTELADKRVETFSGGMKRRLSLAIGIIHEPLILFLDEPTVGIDPASRLFIFENLKAMNANGTTIVYTSHYMEEVQTLCDTAAIMDSGRVIANGRMSALLSRQGKGMIRIRTAPDPTEAVRLDVESLPGAQSAIIKNDLLEIQTQEPEAAIEGVLRLLREKNVKLLSISHGAADLEGLFLSLTGTHLRD
ncbi:MAG: ABC transporter ATP-binding protein [Deltaproteobacteria bacterium]|nr:ABC transporter ATP-binding protein [Deltaproteobacteria bacterium]